MKKINPGAFYEQAKAYDNADPLSSFKDEFYCEDKNLIYLDGNSLGKLPLKTLDLNQNIVKHQWGNRLIRSWNENWIDLSANIAAKIAKLVGAEPDEIFVGDTTSINLFKLAFAAARINPDKNRIITDTLNFPTDLYVLQGLINHHFPSHKINHIKSKNGLSVHLDELQQAMDDNTAFVTLCHVSYKSAFMYDMAKVNSIVHQHHSFVIWDLSHAAGAVPIQLNQSNADMAVGCTYKYLNGGPGAPAFLYVKKELQETLTNPIWAWFSHDKPFDFDPRYKADTGIRRFASSTPSVLSLAAIEPGIDLLLTAGMENIRKKSVLQSEFLMEMIKTELVPLGFTIASPENLNDRGSHISISHPEGYRINRAMIQPMKDIATVIPDFRPPDLIRLGIAPLYNTFTDLYNSIARIKQIVNEKEYESYSKNKLTVT